MDGRNDRANWPLIRALNNHAKEEMMRRLIVGAVIGLLLGAVPAPAQPVAGPAKAKATAPEIPFDSVPNFFKLPAGTYMGEGVGVATNSRGNVFVYVRSGETRLFEFDKTGAFVKEFGVGSYGFAFAHAVRVDKDYNVWAVDEETNIVQKFSPDGRLLMVLGKRPDPLEQLAVTPGGGQYSGANRPYSFHRQTDIGWDPQGNIFVTDGYGTNNRIAKFTKDGNFQKSWGQTGSGQGQFKEIRGIAADAAGNLYVADAGNKRIQVFDGEGTFKSQITGLGTPQAICVSGGATPYLFSSNSNDPESMENGEIHKVRTNGQVVGKFGKAGKLPKQFGMVNAIDCRTENDLWVGEIWNWRAQKVTLRR
jgi:hypothetical protein